MKSETDVEVMTRPLPVLDDRPRPTVADQVFDALQKHILSLALPPGSKISEADIATQMGVSRQPVRDAFYRLSKLGFLTIRPQRATTVSMISEDAVLRAKFIRTALEMETCRLASAVLKPDDIAALQDVLDAQAKAISPDAREAFHALDDAFHREICERAGLGYAWELIQESKTHMDRVRMLSLSTQSQQLAYDEHVVILAAIAAGDGALAADRIRAHLARITLLIDRLKAENHSWFMDDPA